MSLEGKTNIDCYQ